MRHPETLDEIIKVYRDLWDKHPYTRYEQGGSLKLYEYAARIVRIQAEIDTIKFKQENMT